MTSEVMKVVSRAGADSIVLFSDSSGVIHPGAGADLADEVPVVKQSALEGVGHDGDLVHALTYNDVTVFILNAGQRRFACSFSSEEMMAKLISELTGGYDLGKTLILDSDLVDTDMMLHFRLELSRRVADVKMFSRNPLRKDVMSGNYGSVIAVLHPGHEYAEPFADDFYNRLIEEESKGKRLHIRTNRYIPCVDERSSVSAYSYRSGYESLESPVVDNSIPESLILFSSAGVISETILMPYIEKMNWWKGVSKEVVRMVHENSLRSMLAVCFGLFMDKPADVILVHKSLRRTIYEECLMAGSEIALGSPYDAGKIRYVA